MAEKFYHCCWPALPSAFQEEWEDMGLDFLIQTEQDVAFCPRLKAVTLNQSFHVNYIHMHMSLLTGTSRLVSPLQSSSPWVPVIKG